MLVLRKRVLVPVFILFTFLLYSCSNSPRKTLTITPTLGMDSSSPVKTLERTTKTSRVTPTPVSSLNHSPNPTLSKQQLSENIPQWLLDTKNCALPCAFGITPGKSSVEDALQQYNHLGLEASTFQRSQGNMYYAGGDLERGKKFHLDLYEESEVVKVIWLSLQDAHPALNSSFSLETVMATYGKPDDVVLNLIPAIEHEGTSEGGEITHDPAPDASYTMTLFYNKIWLAIEYTGIAARQGEYYQVCPLRTDIRSEMERDDINFVVQNPAGVLSFDQLAEAVGRPYFISGLSMETVSETDTQKFYRLVIEEKSNACISVYKKYWDL